MGSRYYSNVKTLGQRSLQISGSFAPITDANFVPSGDGYDAYGEGWDARRNGVGQYSVHLSDEPVRINSVSVSLELRDLSRALLVLVGGPVGGADGKTISLRVVNTSNVEQELLHDDRIHFSLVLDNSTIIGRRDSQR